MEAYILIDTESGMLWEIAKNLLTIAGVKMAHAVTGQFDVVAFAEFPKVEDFGRIIEKVQQVKGVRRTETLIVVPPTIRE